MLDASEEMEAAGVDNLFATLRHDYDEESQFTTDFNFIDEDGEVVWVHTKEMALILSRTPLVSRSGRSRE
jgi:hypothetical protein